MFCLIFVSLGLILRGFLPDRLSRFLWDERTVVETRLKSGGKKQEPTSVHPLNCPSPYFYDPLQITKAQLSRIQKSDSKSQHILDTSVAVEKYNEMSYAFHEIEHLETQICYAVKCQPSPILLQDLIRNGVAKEVEGKACFGLEAVSANEIELCIDAAMAVGIGSEDITSRIIQCNPNLQQNDMDYALKKGVRNFVVQNPSQLMLLYVKAKELGVHEQVAIMTRIVPPRNATYVSGGKFGSDITLCEKMLQASHNLGMKPRGLATHIGWQTDNSTEMRAKIEDVLRRMAATFKKMKNEYGIELTTLDLGGGWPSQFRGASVPHIRESAAIVAELMDRYFGYLGNQKPDIILEPGNYLAAAAGVTKAHIINIEEPMEGRDFLRCVLDVGKLQGGLIDGHYPVSMIIDGEPVELFVDVNKVQKEPDVPVIVFGPSLDSADRVIADIKLTDHPKIRELFAGAIEANRMDNDIVDKLDDDSAFAVTVAQKVKENFPLPIVLHGTGAYTTALTVGEPGKPGFNGILNPGLTVISNNYVNKTMERELLHLENAHTIEKLKSKIVEEAAWSQFQSERRELQDQLAPTGTSDTVS